LRTRGTHQPGGTIKAEGTPCHLTVKNQPIADARAQKGASAEGMGSFGASAGRRVEKRRVAVASWRSRRARSCLDFSMTVFSKKHWGVREKTR
jgi:hypothetical protein